jgi:hypothetical protein
MKKLFTMGLFFISLFSLNSSILAQENLTNLKVSFVNGKEVFKDLDENQCKFLAKELMDSKLHGIEGHCSKNKGTNQITIDYTIYKDGCFLTSSDQATLFMSNSAIVLATLCN